MPDEKIALMKALKRVWDLVCEKIVFVIVIVLLIAPLRRRKLAKILEYCLIYTKASQDSSYARDSAIEIYAILQRALAQLNQGMWIDEDEMIMLFAPTGDLQETSIDNGWDYQYLILSTQFDRALERHSRTSESNTL